MGISFKRKQEPPVIVDNNEFVDDALPQPPRPYGVRPVDKVDRVVDAIQNAVYSEEEPQIQPPVQPQPVRNIRPQARPAPIVQPVQQEQSGLTDEQIISGFNELAEKFEQRLAAIEARLFRKGI